MTATHSEVDIVLKLWPIFLGVIMLVAWLIRLEQKSVNTKDKLDAHIIDSKKDLSEHKQNMKDSQGEVRDTMGTIFQQNREILKTVSRLEGKLETNKGERYETI